MSRLFQKYDSYCKRIKDNVEDDPIDYLHSAICSTQYGKYEEAKRLYAEATRKFVEQPRLWQIAGTPNRMVDSYVLANRERLFPLVNNMLKQYEDHETDWTYWGQYAFAVWTLVRKEDSEALQYLDKLLLERARKKVKVIYAMGLTIETVVERDQEEFDSALVELIDAHSRSEKWGWHRDSPEGFVCLPGLALSKLAMDRGLVVNVESEYLPIGYLEYLFQHEKDDTETEKSKSTLLRKWSKRK